MGFQLGAMVVMLAWTGDAVSSGPRGERNLDRAMVSAYRPSDIVRVWEDRQRRVRSGRFEWTVSIVDLRASSSATGAGRQGAAGGESNGSAHRTRTKRHSFVFRDDMWRHDFAGPARGRQTGQLRETFSVVVWDGKVEKSWFAVGENSKGGTIRRSTTRLTRSTALRPILLPYRPFKFCKVDFRPQAAEIKPTLGIVRGHRCLIVQQQPLPGLKFEFWVDPGRDFIPVRYQSFLGDRGGNLVDIIYRCDAAHGWVPIKWNEAACLTDPTTPILYSSTGKVVRYSINEPLEDREFEFQFPPDTWVGDQDTGKEYIVRPGNRKRIILKEELARGMKYQDFLRTDTGEVRGAGRAPSGRTLALLIALTLFGTAALLLFGIRRRHNMGQGK